MKDRAKRLFRTGRRVDRALREEMEALGKDLQCLPQYPAEKIHALRTRMKRLRALVELTEKDRPAEHISPAIEHIRFLKDFYSSNRDEAVLAQRLAELQNKKNAPASASPRSQTLVPPEIWRTKAELTDTLTTLDFGSLDADVLESGVSRSLRLCRRQMNRCRKDRSPEAMHEWRKLAKRLFYQLETAARSGRETRRRKLAKKLGEALGEEHDFSLLARRIESDSAFIEESARPLLLEQIGKLRASNQKKAFIIANDLFKNNTSRIRKRK